MSRRLRTYGGVRSAKSTGETAPSWPALLDDKIEEEKAEKVGEREEETHIDDANLPKTFEELGLREDLLKAVQDHGYTTPTLIQAATIPGLLAGDDVMGQAKTGTGKTAAFALPAVQKIVVEDDHVQAIVLCPTRELCLQVCGEVEKFASHSGVKTLAIFGGQPMNVQRNALKEKPHFVVGTPGRVIDFVKRGELDLTGVIYSVLDEADEMLDMGFIDDIRYILRQTSPKRQTALFSATFPTKIRRLARGNMNDPRVIHTSGKRLTVESVTQIFYEVPESQKFKVLCTLLDQEDMSQAVIFARTRWETDVLGKKLRAKGYEVQTIHGDLPQSTRTRVMSSFREGKIDILVATDVAARGLDISAVSHVINYHLPQDPEIYVHRIGRTARMGAEGFAISLVDPQDYHQLVEIQHRADVHIEQRELPSQEEIDQRRRIKIASVLHEEIGGGEFEEYMDGARKILEGVEDPTSIVAFFFRRYYEARFPVKKELSLEDFGNTGAEEGFVRLHLNIGRDQGVTPGDLVKAVASASGIEGSKVGRIDLFDHFSFVQVPSEDAVNVLNGLDEHLIDDVVLHPSPAKPQRHSGSEGSGRDRHRDRDRGRDRGRGGRERERGRDRGSREGGRGRRDRGRSGRERGEGEERKSEAYQVPKDGAPPEEKGDKERRPRRRRRRGPRGEGGGDGERRAYYSKKKEASGEASTGSSGEAGAQVSSPAPAPTPAPAVSSPPASAPAPSEGGEG
jgi:ATP-dependent RNA helicase DeaD